KRFDLLKDCFYKVLQGTPPIQVFEDACKEYSLKYKDKLISHSAFYRMLSNPFYFGEFEWPNGSGNWYTGQHETMVDKDQFDIIQRRLGRTVHTVRRSHEHEYKGLF